MKNMIYLLCILPAIVSCQSNDTNQDNERHFDISIAIKKLSSNQISLHFTIDLDTGYYYVSPHTNGHHQRLIFSIEKSNALIYSGDLMETPAARESYDEISNKSGKFVRKKTEYQQLLDLPSSDDFSVKGMIWLEIRPVLQPYEIHFNIQQKNGILTIDNLQIILSDYPTFFDNKRLDR
jgi:hypothetical protein